MNGVAILKWAGMKFGVDICTEFIWIRIWTTDVQFWQRAENLRFCKTVSVLCSQGAIGFSRELRTMRAIGRFLWDALEGGWGYCKKSFNKTHRKGKKADLNAYLKYFTYLTSVEWWGWLPERNNVTVTLCFYNCVMWHLCCGIFQSLQVDVGMESRAGHVLFLPYPLEFNIVYCTLLDTFSFSLCMFVSTLYHSISGFIQVAVNHVSSHVAPSSERSL